MKPTQSKGGEKLYRDLFFQKEDNLPTRISMQRGKEGLLKSSLITAPQERCAGAAKGTPGPKQPQENSPRSVHSQAGHLREVMKRDEGTKSRYSVPRETAI